MLLGRMSPLSNNQAPMQNSVSRTRLLVNQLKSLYVNLLFLLKPSYMQRISIIYQFSLLEAPGVSDHTHINELNQYMQKINHGLNMGLRYPFSNQVAHSIQILSVIQGSRFPLFSLNIIVCRRFETPLLQEVAYMAILSFYIFSEPHTFGQTFPTNVPMKHQIKIKINLFGKVISSLLEDFENQQ